MTSPPIDASGAIQVSLSFLRWLQLLPMDLASVEVLSQSAGWVTVLSYDQGWQDVSWSPVSLDVSEHADGNPGFRVRFGLLTTTQGHWAGWTVDLLELQGLLRGDCEPYSRPVAGAAGGLTVSRLGMDQIRLSWQADCGDGALYGIYRGDLSAGYGSIAPEPGMCAATGTSISLPLGEGNADFFLVVPSDGVFEGSYGVEGSGQRRVPAARPCHPRDLIDACAP
jgi:hypothetical protein